MQPVLFSEGQERHLLFENPKVGHKEHNEAVVNSAQFKQLVPFHMYPGHSKQKLLSAEEQGVHWLAKKKPLHKEQIVLLELVKHFIQLPPLKT